MILVADSGSTKTNWCYASGESEPEFYRSDGINPFFRTSATIVDELQNVLLPALSGKVKQIYFYGAGVVNEEKAGIIKLALNELFPNASCEVESDLLAAARATLGHSKGIACILGTGANSCLYDGKQIIKHVPPLGYILGDEGSGTYLGRRLLADYLKKIMPVGLAQRFRKTFPYDYAEFLNNVYKNESVRMYLAGFVPFIKENIEESYCNNLVIDSFNAFVNRNVARYPDFQKHKVSFIGSVAFHFQEQLKTVLANQNLQPGVILTDPLEALVKYHLEIVQR